MASGVLVRPAEASLTTKGVISGHGSAKVSAAIGLSDAAWREVSIELCRGPAARRSHILIWSTARRCDTRTFIASTGVGAGFSGWIGWEEVGVAGRCRAR